MDVSVIYTHFPEVKKQVNGQTVTLTGKEAAKHTLFATETAQSFFKDAIWQAPALSRYVTYNLNSLSIIKNMLNYFNNFKSQPNLSLHDAIVEYAIPYIEYTLQLQLNGINTASEPSRKRPAEQPLSQTTAKKRIAQEESTSAPVAPTTNLVSVQPTALNRRTATPQAEQATEPAQAMTDALPVPQGTTPQVPMGTTPQVPMGTTPQALQVPMGTTTPQAPQVPQATTTPQVPMGTTPQAPQATTTPQMPMGTTPQVPQGTTPQVPKGTTPNETTPQVPKGTTPNETTPQVPQGTTPNGTTPQVPNGTTPQVPKETTPQVPQGTTPQVPKGTTRQVQKETTEQVPSENNAQAPDATLPIGTPKVTTKKGSKRIASPEQVQKPMEIVLDAMDNVYKIPFQEVRLRQKRILDNLSVDNYQLESSEDCIKDRDALKLAIDTRMLPILNSQPRTALLQADESRKVKTAYLDYLNNSMYTDDDVENLKSSDQKLNVIPNGAGNQCFANAIVHAMACSNNFLNQCILIYNSLPAESSTLARALSSLVLYVRKKITLNRKQLALLINQVIDQVNNYLTNTNNSKRYNARQQDNAAEFLLHLCAALASDQSDWAKTLFGSCSYSVRRSFTPKIQAEYEIPVKLHCNTSTGCGTLSQALHETFSVDYQETADADGFGQAYVIRVLKRAILADVLFLEFPPEIIIDAEKYNLSEYTLDGSNENHFAVRALVYHIGDVAHGHFFTLARLKGDATLYYLNDLMNKPKAMQFPALDNCHFPVEIANGHCQLVMLERVKTSSKSKSAQDATTID